MGDISIIARRKEDGQVQYGWSGNGGYFRMVGARLLSWYQKPEDVDYLFELGQTRLIGKKGSEQGGYSFLETHCLTGEPFWQSRTEQSIFSKIAFVDYGYFYDLDHKWYYIVPGPFRIKLPLELIEQNLDESGYEFDFLKEVEDRVLKYIFGSYIDQNVEFMKYMEKNNCTLQSVIKDINVKGMLSVMEFYNRYKKIYDYFDDWILIKTNADNTEIVDIIVTKHMIKHIETCKW